MTLVSRSSIAAPLTVLASNPKIITGVSTDASLDLLRGLALAQNALSRLGEQGVDFTLSGQSLVLPWLERCYREALYVRSHRVDPKQLDTTVITRFGRLA